MKRAMRENLSKQREMEDLNNQVAEIITQISALKDDIKLLRGELSSVKDGIVRVSLNADSTKKDLAKEISNLESNSEKRNDNLSHQISQITGLMVKKTPEGADIKPLQEELSSVKRSIGKDSSNVEVIKKDLIKELTTVESNNAKRIDDLSQQLSQVTSILNRTTTRAIQRLLVDLKRLRDKEREEAEK